MSDVATTPGTAATRRPLRAVLESIEAGTSSVADVAARTGLQPDVVRGAVDNLVRLGRLSAEAMAFGCPSGGCGSCASARGGTPACGLSRASAQRQGPVLVTLRVR